MSTGTMRRFVLLSLLLSAMAAVTSCGDNDDEGEGQLSFEFVSSDLPRETPAATDTDLRDFSHDGLAFGIELLGQITDAAAGDENAAVSPVSIRSAFALAYAGARGETRSQIGSTLRFDEDQTTTHDRFNALETRLDSYQFPAVNGHEPVELKLVNSLWPAAGFELRETYLDTIARHYGAGLRVLDYQASPERARLTINQWVSDNTQQKIPELLAKDSIDANTVLYITNALYLKAPWISPFEESETQVDQFFLANGTTKEASFMHQQHEETYGAGDDWQALQLYLRGSKLAMLFILPDAGTFGDFEADLTPELIDEIVADLELRQIDVTLPRFSFRATTDLKVPLTAMGMLTPFTNDANFGEMFPFESGVGIGGASHEAFVNIDEGGVEAAAATSLGFDVSAPPEPYAYFRADRPFYFIIRDADLGTPLFIGRVMDPTSGE